MTMLPFKRILCPTDFSEPSYEALKTGNELALHFSAELFLVHVISKLPMALASAFPDGPGAPGGLTLASYQQKLEVAAEKRLKELADKKVPQELNVRLVVEDGNAANGITQVAEYERIDLIVIAAHGEAGWESLMLGSVAESVVRLARCPVLTIGTPPKRG
jgi:nucleotide-binding universal stress UspA family protein